MLDKEYLTEISDEIAKRYQEGGSDFCVACHGGANGASIILSGGYTGPSLDDPDVARVIQIGAVVALYAASIKTLIESAAGQARKHARATGDDEGAAAARAHTSIMVAAFEAMSAVNGDGLKFVGPLNLDEAMKVIRDLEGCDSKDSDEDSLDPGP